MWVCEVCGKNDTPESNICKIPGHVSDGLRLI